jgi:peptide/nickel transport system substrate-binding protein
MFPVKEEKLRMQVVSASNALDKLANGEVDFVTPQYTNDNAKRLSNLKSKGIESLNSWQLGYGYIGINAGKVENIYLRRAIMSAMNVATATEYYLPGECKTINWPMSTVSWAYPYESNGSEKTPAFDGNGYLLWEGDEQAKAKIRNYMALAEKHNSATAKKLKYTFTIAGAAITEHPTYQVFQKAAELLNECGWDVEVTPDSQALTKLATGSLAVWAAAWGSSLDPDMYQIYHRNSSATSTYAWGYREIKNDTVKYKMENDLIKKLSVKIDEGRATLDQEDRTGIYEEAMELVLQLAVEMPVYQRKTLYAYNAKRLSGINKNVNPYTSPLEEIWNIELVK